MPYEVNETHDPKLESWIESANDPATDFPIQNLPICEFTRAEHKSGLTDNGFGVPIGNMMLQIGELAEAHLFDGIDEDEDFDLCEELWLPSVFAFASSRTQQNFRKRLSELLQSDNDELRSNKSLLKAAMIPIDDVVFHTPALEARDYTDFYASLYHATNVGTMFRPNDPILPNYKHIPIAYHGRASTIGMSGRQVRRPCGQILPGATIADGNPVFGPCKLLDYELEVGLILGRGNEDNDLYGQPIAIDDAEDHILGMCLVNDWSARDIQKWEYQPLGPFLAKSFATSISPYIVTMEALAPFRSPALARDPGDPTPLPHLSSERNTAMGGVDITLEVFLSSAKMREQGLAPIQLSKGSFKDMYWTISQMLAHHSSNGCLMQSGDLLASGTVSGPTRSARGCLLELTWDGDPFAETPIIVPGTKRTPIDLPTGEQRKFLADGDEIIIKGYCERDGFRRIGFGECRGIIAPALT